MATEAGAGGRVNGDSHPEDRALATVDVEFLYEQLLGRSARPDEAAQWLAATDDWRALLQAIVLSEEFAKVARARGGLGGLHLNLWTPELAAHALAPGTVSPGGDVLVGEEGWLFLVGGTNAVRSQYAEGAQFEPDALARWHDAVEWRSSWCATQGLSTASIIVPDKLWPLRAFLPNGHPALGEGLARQLVNEFPHMMYPTESLADPENFLRTDTHLTLKGATRVANAVFGELGLAASPAPAATPALAVGELGAHFEPGILEIVDAARSLGAARVVADNSAEMADKGIHVGTFTILENQAAPDPRTVVIFGDSFARAKPDYQGLAWFAAQQFRNVHFAWDPFGFDPGYVEQARADIVVFEMAERFVVRPPRTTAAPTLTE